MLVLHRLCCKEADHRPQPTDVLLYREVDLIVTEGVRKSRRHFTHTNRYEEDQEEDERSEESFELE